MSKVKDVIESMFMIHDKNGDLVPFKLNSVQTRLDQVFNEEGTRRGSIVKFRQGGCTSYIMAWFLVDSIHKFNTCVMLAHDKDHTEKLLYRAQLLLMNMKPKPPKTRKMNDNEIIFEKTQSSFYIGTAGSSNFGRSATISKLHCSEIAFWPNPKRIYRGLLQAVPKESGVVVEETTGNGWGTWHQKHYYSLLGENKQTKPLFFPWYIFNEYESPILSSFHPTLEEVKLIETLHLLQPSLTPEQIHRKLQWRREKLEEFENDVDEFNQEYPTIMEDAFRLTGSSLFQRATRTESDLWKPLDTKTSILEGHPKKGYTYVLGADSAGGTGNDSSTIVGMCLETREQILEYKNSRISPPEFAEVIITLGKMFNEAYLVPEANSHGLSVLAIVRENYERDKIYKSSLFLGVSTQQHNIPSYGYGWRTTGISKPYLVGVAQKFIIDGWKIYSPTLHDQLLSFTETSEGKLEGVGDEDDVAIAFMCSCIGMLKVLQMKGLDLKTPFEEKEKVDEEKNEEKKKIVVTWRDEQGRNLIPFKDMFGYKKRSVHLS